MLKLKETKRAPANIALIKYMGKQKNNIPTNISFSYTLQHLISEVEIEITDNTEDSLEILTGTAPKNLKIYGNKKISFKTELSATAKNRFLAHFTFLKNHFNITKNFMIRSCNYFPMNCGLASSASSFAALTHAAVSMFCKLLGKPLLPINEIAQLSQRGSGSSCRSFFSPWTVWDANGVSAVALPQKELLHAVIIIDAAPKEISSSEAHQRVTTSPHYGDRQQRAQIRYQNLLTALTQKNWLTACEIAWEEFWDMHELFHTAAPAFSYLLPESKETLIYLKNFWSDAVTAPLITMDAGANIHILMLPQQKPTFSRIIAELSQQHLILGNA